jgi:hypothetical protein
MDRTMRSLARPGRKALSSPLGPHLHGSPFRPRDPDPARAVRSSSAHAAPESRIGDLISAGSGPRGILFVRPHRGTRPRAVDQSEMIVAHDLLGELRDLLRSGHVPSAKGLAQIGANPVVWTSGPVAIASTPTSMGMGTPGLEDVSVLIVTPQAEPLAWLFQKLQAIFGDLAPKNFVRGLGEAAYWFQEDYPDDDSAEGILGAVLDEASAQLRKLAGDRVLPDS